MKVLLVLSVYVFHVCSSASVYEYGVGAGDQATVVNKHNAVRDLIRKGQVPGQPRGVNLKQMHWDNNLAIQAQNIANTCIFGHVKVNDGRWPAVGQNIAATYDSTFRKGADWDGAVQMWYDEYKVYHYPNGFSTATGHYTQVVWDDTDNIGCGYAYCPNQGQYKYMKLYVCNYGPAGNYPRAPYQTG